ncbi:hypothetical protein VOLCADRAFT_93664 [Volvox carteri f. nagariensis]|uniref:Uncharacterized protein n=1 Tax=Volvox carteri f. nagariensis TaxID=3068 RepID=D8U2Q1_VOLCA|nr:uncharacterized protein VOLCADRAFT_93664 [Volvox carteri f. nagariensis]EFJ45846.1 hypothetical protein VOLCADRAFT_93664 [Volvox carteri f. nagariensis]|eukprot:XP_002952924.1 hypothetical protein VOLCADRAFT_93664 [Volvox carteri f. nagariensis]
MIRMPAQLDATGLDEYAQIRDGAEPPLHKLVRPERACMPPSTSPERCSLDTAFLSGFGGESSPSCLKSASHRAAPPSMSTDEDDDFNWNSFPITESHNYFAPWMDPEKLSPPASQAHVHHTANAAASGSASVNASSSGIGWGRQLGSAGYFSAWLRGECLAATEVDLSSTQGALLEANSATTAAYVAPPLLAATQLSNLGLDLVAGAGGRSAFSSTSPPLHESVEVPPLSDPTAASSCSGSSIPSPLGSDCRGAADECGGYESGRSSSMSLFSWDAQSSGSGGSDPDAEAAGWATSPDAAAAPRGSVEAWRVLPRGGRGRTSGVCDCVKLRIVECDVWEREVEAKLLCLESRHTSVPAPAGAAETQMEAQLNSLVCLVVTEALFD